jgi:hypothetical protein
VQHYLWRAVDQHHVVLDILVQARRDAQAATRLFKRLLMGLQYELQVIVTDKLRSYDVAQRQLLPGVEHRQSRYLNGLRPHTDPRDDESGRCNDSNRLGKPSTSSPPTPSFPAISVPADIN